MYVYMRMCVRMYVCTYVCVYVCMCTCVMLLTELFVSTQVISKCTFYRTLCCSLSGSMLMYNNSYAHDV